MYSKETKIGLVATFFTLTAFALSSNAIPPLITTIAREFHVPFETVGGYMILIQFGVFALASLSGGWAAARFGWSNRSLAVTGVLTLGVLLMLAAFFPTFSWYLALTVPLGFAGGLVETFSSILLCRFGGNQSSKILNLSQVFFCFGALFAPFFVGQVLGLGIPWRWTFLGLGIIAFIIGLTFTSLTRNLKEPQPDLPAVSENVQHPNPAKSVPFWSDALFYLMSAALFLYVVVEGSIVVWIPSYFEKYLEVHVSSAAWRLSIYWLGLVFGRSLMLVLHGRWTLWPAVLVGAAGMVAVCAVMITRWSSSTATILVLLAGFLSGPIWPTIVTLSQHVRDSGQFTSGVIAAGALGAGIGPFTSSFVIAKLGMTWFFPVLTALSLLLLASVFAAKLLAASRPKHLQIDNNQH